MSKTLDQIYIANPITSNASTDLMYFVQSPYTPGLDAGMTYGNFYSQQWGNLGTNANALISTNTNGAINITPNGTGIINFRGTTSFLPSSQSTLQYASTTKNGELSIAGYNGHYAGLSLYRSASTSVGSFAAVSNNLLLGDYQVWGDDGTQFTQACALVGACDGTVSTGIVPGRWDFYTTNASGVSTKAMSISKSQVVTFTNPLTLTTPNIGAATATSINFGGTSLSNYTEGTFVPTLSFATPGDLSVVYSTHIARYTRIGRMVFGNIYMVCTPTFTTASGALQISTLPYTVGAYDGSGAVVLTNTGITFSSGKTYMNAQPVSGATYVYLTQLGSATASSQIGTTNLVSGVAITIEFDFTYSV